MAAASTTASQNSALGWAKILGKIFYLLLALLIVFLVFKSSGWNWGLISLFVAAFGYVLIFLESDLKRLALFILVTLYFATDFSIGIYRLLTTDERVMAAIRESPALTFLLAGPSDRLVWSIILGFLLALLFTLIPLLILAFVSAFYVLALHKMDGVSWWDAMLYIISLILGINSAYIIVENGQAVITKEAAKLGVLGGPGHLIIKQGNVVVLERGGKITRIVNAGVVKLKPLETIRNIFALNVQSSPAETTRVEHVLTKDRIPLTITAKIAFQLEPASEADKRTESRIAPNGEALTPKLDDGLYQVYEGTVRKAALMSQRVEFPDFPIIRFVKCEEVICRDIQVTKWQNVAGSAPEGELRDYIMSHRFDELFELNDSAPGEKPDVRVNKRKIYEIEQAILAEIKPKKIAALGILVRGVDIGKIEFPIGAEQLLLNRWGAPWQQQIDLIGAETDLQARVLGAQGDQQARMLEAQGELDAGSLNAQAIIIHARAEAQRRIMEGRSHAEARAAFFRFIVEALQVDGRPMDPDLTRAILQQLAGTFAAVDDLETFVRVQGRLNRQTVNVNSQGNLTAVN
jgi:regulator of protease activity HflC (stomatin/prohibitin superfamily)